MSDTRVSNSVAAMQDSDELEEVEKEVQEKEAKRAAGRSGSAKKDHGRPADTLSSLVSTSTLQQPRLPKPVACRVDCL